MIQVLYDVLSEDEIQSLLDEYNSYEEYRNPDMKKADPGPATKIIDELMYGYKRTGGNYYQHSKPYWPHTDHKEQWGNSINVVVPLHTTDLDASLVVFDQQYLKDSVTWCLNFNVFGFKDNSGIVGRPYDYKEVTKLSDQPISDELYEKLKWADKDQWFGLTGQALEFKPGNILLFDNKNIHATGLLNGTKTGLSLRYKL